MGLEIRQTEDSRDGAGEFAKAIVQKTKRVILLKGNATEKILDAIKKYAQEEHAFDQSYEKQIEIADSMVVAVSLAQTHAEKGDVVLLSPGAASFGLFANEFDRGEKFKDAVAKLV